jgi:putative (di)nucleoside polyphosphate hydrolase
MVEEEFKIIKLRQAVSAVIFKENKFIMMSGKDWPEGSWAFPQGGLESGETHFLAIERELKEELGTDNFKILGKSTIEHSYLFPDKIRKKKGCEGQYQTIWFVEFTGEENEIKPDPEELMQCSWFDQDEILSNMQFPEQIETFEKVLKELTELRNSKIF